jgi:hypothetical protein
VSQVASIEAIPGVAVATVPEMQASPSPAEVIFGQSEAVDKSLPEVPAESSSKSLEAMRQALTDLSQAVNAETVVPVAEPENAFTDILGTPQVETAPVQVENAFGDIFQPSPEATVSTELDASEEIDANLTYLEAALTDLNARKIESQAETRELLESLSQFSTGELTVEKPEVVAVSAPATDEAFMVPAPPADIEAEAAKIAAEQEARQAAALERDSLKKRVDENEDFVGNNDTKISGGRTGGETRQGEEFVKPKVYSIKNGEWVDETGEVAVSETHDATTAVEAVAPTVETSSAVAPSEVATSEPIAELDKLESETTSAPMAEELSTAEAEAEPPTVVPEGASLQESEALETPTSVTTAEAADISSGENQVKTKAEDPDDIETTAYLQQQDAKYVQADKQREKSEVRERDLMELYKIDLSLQKKMNQQDKLITDLSGIMGLTEETIVNLIRTDVSEEAVEMPLAA